MINVSVERKRLIKKWPTKMKDVNDKFLPQAAKIVEAEAKRRAPVDTGRLRSSINSGVSGDVAKVGTDVEYAPYMEYGTSRFPTGKPFLRPALDVSRKALVKLYRQIFRRVYGGR